MLEALKEEFFPFLAPAGVGGGFMLEEEEEFPPFLAPTGVGVGLILEEEELPFLGPPRAGVGIEVLAPLEGSLGVW